MRGRRPGFRVTTVLALAGALSAVAVGPISAADQPRVTRPVRMTPGDVVPTRTYSSPAMAVDPEDDQTIIASYAEMRSAGCGVARSRDGGRTWARLKEPPLPASYPFCFAPLHSSNVHFSPVAFGRNHTLYLAAAAWDVQDGRSTSVLLARSEDLGDTWSVTVVRNARGRPEADPEENRQVSSVAVDTSGPTDRVYVAWTLRRPNARPLRPPEAVVAASADGGRTFSDPLNVVGRHFEEPRAIEAVFQNRATVLPAGLQPTPADAVTSEKFGGGVTRVVTGPPGTVYALWTAVAVVVPGPTSNFYLSRSTDHGSTYSVTQILPPSRTLSSPVVAWSPVGGAEGTLHLVYENKVPHTQGDRDIHYQRSTDGGRTWGPPRVINDDDPNALIGQFMPSVSVAPNGRVDVAWWDFRNDTGAFLNDVYLSSSSDNGVSWSPNLRVTDRPIDRMIGPWANGYDVRQPPGLAPTARYTLVGWDDTRNGDRDAQAQDMYGSFVQFEALPARTPPAHTYGLAAVVGLLLAGTIVSVIGVVNRRRTGPPPASRAPSSATPVGVN